MSLDIAWLMRHTGVPNGYSTASSYQVPTSSKYYSTPTSFLAGYSTVSSYQVPTSSKYYSTPTSFLVGIGVTWHIRHR